MDDASDVYDHDAEEGEILVGFGTVWMHFMASIGFTRCVLSGEEEPQEISSDDDSLE